MISKLREFKKILPSLFSQIPTKREIFVNFEDANFHKMKYDLLCYATFILWRGCAISKNVPVLRSYGQHLSLFLKTLMFSSMKYLSWLV